jgi:hypothetical protein
MSHVTLMTPLSPFCSMHYRAAAAAAQGRRARDNSKLNSRPLHVIHPMCITVPLSESMTLSTFSDILQPFHPAYVTSECSQKPADVYADCPTCHMTLHPYKHHTH